MDKYVQMASLIIKEQKHIMGPVAIMQASKVKGLHIKDENTITIDGDQKQAISDLVNQYAKLFGNASIEISKEAIEPIRNEIADQNEIPDILR